MIPTLEDIIRGLLNGTMTYGQAELYFKEHERLQDEVDALEHVPYERGVVALDVLKKCSEQDRRWGARQYPSFHQGVTANADLGQYAVAGQHEVVNAQRARLLTQEQDAAGELSWMTILVEEVAKLTEKYEDPSAVRAQLIDVAGVAMQWATQLTPAPEFQVGIQAHDDGSASLVVEADHEGPNRGE